MTTGFQPDDDRADRLTTDGGSGGAPVDHADRSTTDREPGGALLDHADRSTTDRDPGGAPVETATASVASGAPVEAPSPLPSSSPLDRTFLTNLPGVTTLLLIRHGKQHFAHRLKPVTSDWVDPPLSATGQRQAEALGWALASEPIDAVYASPLQRALTTAREVAKHHDLEPTVVEDLREVELFRDVPEGANVNEILGAEEVGRLQERFINERRWDVYPLSESSAAFRSRIVAAIDAIAARHPGQRVAVACHSGVANGYVATALGLLDDMIFRAAHASVSRVLVGYDRRVVHSLNETHHLWQVDPSLVTV